MPVTCPFCFCRTLFFNTSSCLPFCILPSSEIHFTTTSYVKGKPIYLKGNHCLLCLRTTTAPPSAPLFLQVRRFIYFGNCSSCNWLLGIRRSKQTPHDISIVFMFTAGAFPFCYNNCWFQAVYPLAAFQFTLKSQNSRGTNGAVKQSGFNRKMCYKEFLPWSSVVLLASHIISLYPLKCGVHRTLQSARSSQAHPTVNIGEGAGEALCNAPHTAIGMPTSQCACREIRPYTRKCQRYPVTYYGSLTFLFFFFKLNSRLNPHLHLKWL